MARAHDQWPRGNCRRSATVAPVARQPSRPRVQAQNSRGGASPLGESRSNTARRGRQRWRARKPPAPRRA
eukprot:5385984-Lingulodinium_polyedra.AAC.1